MQVIPEQPSRSQCPQGVCAEREGPGGFLMSPSGVPEARRGPVWGELYCSFFPTFRRNSKNSCMITKPEPMFTPADVMGPRATPLVPVVVTMFTRDTPARLPPSRF